MNTKVQVISSNGAKVYEEGSGKQHTVWRAGTNMGTLDGQVIHIHTFIPGDTKVYVRINDPNIEYFPYVPDPEVEAWAKKQAQAQV